MTGSTWALIAGVVIACVAINIWHGAAASSLFADRGRERWRGWLPVVRDLEFFRWGKVPTYIVPLLFVPIVGIYALVMRGIALRRIGRIFGWGTGMAVLGVLLPPVWTTIAAVRVAGADEQGDDVDSTTGGTGGEAPVRAVKTPASPSARKLRAQARAAARAEARAARQAQTAAKRASAVKPAAQTVAPAFSPPATRPAFAPPAETPIVQAPAPVAPGAPAHGVATPVPASAPVPAPAAPAPAPLTPADIPTSGPLTPADIPAPAASVPASAAPSARFVLLVFDGESVPLTSDRVVVGRAPTSDDSAVQCIALKDTTRTLSKSHAQFFRMDDTWFVTDLGSTNGVSVAARRSFMPLAAHASAPAGGEVRLGDVRVMIRPVAE